MEPMEFLEPQESMAMMDTMESFDQKVERIARAYFEKPCPPGAGPYCCADMHEDMHDWDTGHPDDKAHWRDTVRFILTEAGL
jgi:hypothetical protein